MLQKPDITMDDLLAKDSNLTVLDEDGWEINEAGGDVAGGHCAKGRFCSNKPMSRPLLKTILGRVWGIADNKWGVEIKHINKQSSFLVFTFKSAQDLNRILGKNPWFLNYGTLILEREVIDVQMADIPRIVTKDFFTFKVWCDITKPLFPGLLFPSIGGKKWLPFSYERLPFMCFNCGFLGYDTQVCAETPKMFEDGLGNWKQTYGPWLKADDKREAIIYSKSTNNVLIQQNEKCPALNVEEGSSNNKQRTVLGVEVSAAINKSPEKMADVNLGLFNSGSNGNYFENLTRQRDNKLLMMEKGESSQVNCKRNGSWRNDHESLKGFAAMEMESEFDSEGLRKSRPGEEVDYNNLVEIPISYDVGIESTIRINEDAWLPRGMPFSLRTKALLPEGTTLDKLINNDGKWKTNEVHSWFHKDDIPWVLGIISITSRPDCPILKAWWKFIWSSKLIPKMKNFIWRVFNQWIPTKIELSKRGMSLETTCDWCHEIEEDICHALWFCPKVLKIWKLAGFDTQNFIHMPKAPDLLFYLWGKLPKEEMLQFIGLSWLIWQHRNKLIFKHQAQEIHSWVRWALEKLDDYFEESKHSRQDRVVKANQKWGPPPIDCVMINTDASLIVDKLGCGLSVVIRDSARDLIVAETVFLPGIASVYLAEAAAVHLGVRLARKWAVSKAIVAADCLSIIDSLQSGSALHSDWGMLSREILSLKHHFLSLNFTHVHRDCNAVANALAIWSRMTHSS
ncbi:hypothetical protein G4B88_029571 [Cannabis sativa]|uniref:RNase H type-1 domain-containing protein n=1 Tax=Cannabis sativa TaxID=3483 RepID=A0A7J6FFJ3_CANSA|nr:hypothetical protein G4B88_029571 [Cannabis sativa]